AGRSERFGFSQFRDADAERARLNLAFRNLHGFVGLGMWPERDVLLARMVGHAGNVARHRIEVDDQRGCLQLPSAARHADQAFIQLLRAHDAPLSLQVNSAPKSLSKPEPLQNGALVFLVALPFSRTMKTFYSPLHLEHAPREEFEAGRLSPAVEIPERAERVRRRIEERKLGPILPAGDFGEEPILRVHDRAFVRFMTGAYENW